MGVSAFGVQCINVTWSGPNEGLRGTKRIYFVTYSKSDSDMSVTLNAGDSMFLPIRDLTPGNNYNVEVCIITKYGTTCSMLKRCDVHTSNVCIQVNEKSFD